MKEQIFRAMAIICCIGLIGTVGGLEWSMFGFGRCCVQSVLFMAGMVFFHKAAERTTRRRKAHR